MYLIILENYLVSYGGGKPLFLDYAHHTHFTASENPRTFDKDGVISVKTSSSTAYICVDDCWVANINGMNTIVFPVKAGQVITVTNAGDIYFIPYLY